MNTPATQFHIDHLKGMTMDQIRENWKAGHYTGICPKWAAFYAKHYEGVRG